MLYIQKDDSMTKRQFISKVAQKSALSQKDTSIVIESAVETLIELLKDQDSISFAGFGSFSTIEKSAREVRLPSSGEMMHIHAKRAVKFRVGKVLKEAINQD
jgi:DNA-binding protein HU-beta